MNLLSDIANLPISGGVTKEAKQAVDDFVTIIGESLIKGAIIGGVGFGLLQPLPAAIVSGSLAPIANGVFYRAAIGASIPLYVFGAGAVLFTANEKISNYISSCVC